MVNSRRFKSSKEAWCRIELFISNFFVFFFLVIILYKIVLDFLWKETEEFTLKRKNIDFSLEDRRR